MTLGEKFRLFCRGMGSILCIFPRRTIMFRLEKELEEERRAYLKRVQKEDAAALAGDWKKVGDGLKKAMGIDLDIHP